MSASMAVRYAQWFQADELANGPALFDALEAQADVKAEDIVDISWTVCFKDGSAVTRITKKGISTLSFRPEAA